MAELKKISQLPIVEQFDGTESVPILKSGGNPRATLGDLREYFRDSTLVIFDGFDETDRVANVENSREDGAVFDIVYLTNQKFFAERKTKGDSKLYSTAFTRNTDYQDGEVVRTDKVFFNLAEQRLYTWDGNALTDPYAPIVLAQAEYDALPVKDENKTYYIIEA